MVFAQSDSVTLNGVFAQCDIDKFLPTDILSQQAMAAFTRQMAPLWAVVLSSGGPQHQGPVCVCFSVGGWGHVQCSGTQLTGLKSMYVKVRTVRCDCFEQ